MARPILRPAKEPPLPKIQHPAGHPRPECTGEQTLSLSFVSPNYIALEQWEESVCRGRVNSYPTRFVAPMTAFVNHWRLSPDGWSLPVPAVLSAEAVDDFQRSAREACVTEERKQQQDPQENFVPLPNCKGTLFDKDSRDWSIQRGEGRWEVVAKLAGWRGEVIYYVVPLDLPSAVAPSQHEAHVDAGPGGGDILVSPNAQVVAEVDAKSITIKPVGAVLESESTFVVPKGAFEEIVMVEWATGRFVERWSRTLNERFGSGNR